MVLGALLLSYFTSGSQIDNLLASPALKGSLTGVCVTDMYGEVLYQHLGNSRFVPASNQKILTAVFALAVLGEDHKPRTKFWRDPNKLYVDSLGDPSIQRAQLLGIRSRFGLDGDTAIYVRQAYRPGVPPTWEWDDLPNRYAPRITSLSFDRGGFEVWSNADGVVALPNEYRINLRHVSGSASSTFYYPEKRLVVVKGPLSQSEHMIEAFAIPDPDAVAARFMGGTIVHADSVPSRDPDFVLTGHPLSETIKFCLEKSDNSYAEHFLLMSASRKEPLGDNAYKSASGRMLSFFENTVGVEEGSVIPVDGSGMSRQNLVTPRTLCKVLSWANRQPWRATFFSALAAPGEGTLSSRLQSSRFMGKTGTLNAVICLSGYVEAANGRKLAVSMLFNNTNSANSEIREIQDKIISLIEREVF